jgi:hypothetical protein
MASWKGVGPLGQPNCQEPFERLGRENASRVGKELVEAAVPHLGLAPVSREQMADLRPHRAELVEEHVRPVVDADGPPDRLDE